MPQITKMLRCDSNHCRGRATPHLKNEPNHMLHLIASILTGGVWIPFWIIASMIISAPVCTQCGKKEWFGGL